MRRRDREAWNELYGYYAPRLRAVARRILPTRLDPEGAAQETWFRALQAAPRFARRSGSDRDPYPWLCSICINCCISVIRKDKAGRHPRVEGSLLQRARMRTQFGLFAGSRTSSEAYGLGDGLLEDGLLGQEAHEERYDEFLPQFTRQDLLRVIENLPKSLQRVLYLRFWCGLSIPVVAELLRISVGAVRKRLSRAYRILRDELGGGEQE